MEGGVLLWVLATVDLVVSGRRNTREKDIFLNQSPRQLAIPCNICTTPQIPPAPGPETLNISASGPASQPRVLVPGWLGSPGLTLPSLVLSPKGRCSKEARRLPGSKGTFSALSPSSTLPPFPTQPVTTGESIPSSTSPHADLVSASVQKGLVLTRRAVLDREMHAPCVQDSLMQELTLFLQTHRDSTRTRPHLQRHLRNSETYEGPAHRHTQD